MQIKRIWRITFVLLLVSFLAPRSAHACSCAFDPSITKLARLQENLNSQYTDFVFVGKVQQARLENPGARITSGADPIYVTFDVGRVFKGEIAPQFTLTTARDGAACGFDFREGATYLVFVRADSTVAGQWNSGLCSNNTRNPSLNILARLGNSHAPAIDGTAGMPLPDNLADVLAPADDVIQDGFFSKIGLVEMSAAIVLLVFIIWWKTRRNHA